jgi:putative flippase GtrA
MTTVIFDPKERTRFVRFALVGMIGAVVDFGVSNLLIQVLDAPLVLAGTISFVMAILSNFYWNRRWTYPDSRSKPMPAQLVQFAIVSVVGLAIRIPVLAYLEPVMETFTRQFNLQIPGILDSRILADNLTLAIAVIIVMFWNFFANRYWTYNDVL